MRTIEELVFLRRHRSVLVRVAMGADEEDWRVSLLLSLAFSSGEGDEGSEKR